MRNRGSGAWQSHFNLINYKLPEAAIGGLPFGLAGCAVSILFALANKEKKEIPERGVSSFFCVKSSSKSTLKKDISNCHFFSTYLT